MHLGSPVKLRAAIALGAVAVSIFALGSQNGGERADAASATTGAVVTAAPSQFGDLRSGQPLRLFLTIDDQAGAEIPAGTATVLVDRTPLGSRDSLEDWFTGKSKASLASSSVAHADTPVITGGGNHSMAISIPASQLHFHSTGVYAIAVSVTAGGENVGSSRTAVTWKATGSDAVPVALAAPLTVPAGSGGFISSAELATDTAPDGVLTRELNDLENTQVAIGIDPRILASINILGKTAPDSAIDWLQQLKAVSNQTFPLTWGDADLTVALQAGDRTVPKVKPLDYAIVPSRFASAPAPADTSTPAPVTTPDPSNPPLPTSKSLTEFNYTLPELRWPAENTVAKTDVVKLEDSGISSVILSSTNVSRPSTRVPAGASAQVGDLAVAVSDTTISNYLRAAAESTTRADWTSAMAKLSSSIAMVGMLSGGDSNTILATFGRNWQDADTNFSSTLTGIFTRSWISAAELTDATTAKAQSVAIRNRPQEAERVARVRAMLSAERREVRFSVVAAPDQQTLTSARRLVLLSLLSDEWLDNPTGWNTATRAFLKASHKIVTSVQVVRSSDVLLLGDQVSLPVTLSNTLAQPVTVYVAVRPRTTLISVDKGHRLQEVTINAESQRRVEIPIQSLSNGKVEVAVSLYSSSGRHIGTTQSVNINVQAGWETFGTLIFAALVVGIFAFGLVRNIRKRRKAAREDGDAAADPSAEESSATESSAAERPGE